MGMRYAGFMAGAREDRLLREQRESEDAIREETWQRQIERDDAAHQRQKELLDIRHKNSLKLSGISASRTQAASDAKLKKKVDAFIKINGLEDSPKIRSDVAAGMEFYGADTFMKGYKSGEIRIAKGMPDNPDPEPSSEYSLGETVERVEAPTVNMNNSPATMPSLDLDKAPGGSTRLSTKSVGPDAVDQQMSEAMPKLDDIGSQPINTQPVDTTELALGSPVEEKPEPKQESGVSYGNLPYLKTEVLLGKEADEAEQIIRMYASKGYSDEELKPLKDELDFIRKAEKSGEDSFSGALADADTLVKLSNLQQVQEELKAEGEIDDTELARRQDSINKSLNNLVEVQRRNAEKDGTPLMFYTMTSAGTFGTDAMMVMKKDGKYIDQAGNEVDVSKGKVLPPDAGETFMRNYNVQSQKIADIVAEGTNAVQSLTNYRELVIDSPEGLNRYLSVAGELVSQANSIKSAVEGLTTGQYEYTAFENRMMSVLRDLSAEDRRIARAQLRAAYAMAAFSGSSGQALSDKELVANLEAIGQGVTDPKKVVGLINDNINDVITMTEQKRAPKFESFIADPALKDSLRNTPVGMPFIDYLNTPTAGIDDRTRKSYLDALNGKVDYPYKSVDDETGTSSVVDFSQITFEQFKQDLAKRSPEVDEAFTEDQKREYFLRQGGKL